MIKDSTKKETSTIKVSTTTEDNLTKEECSTTIFAESTTDSSIATTSKTQNPTHEPEGIPT